MKQSSFLQKQKKEYPEYKEKNLKENPLQIEFAERMNKKTNKQYEILETYECKLEVILQKKQEALAKANSSRILRNKDKYKLINNINNNYAQDILAHNIAKQKELEAIKEPFSTWHSFLKYKSEQGDKFAGDLLEKIDKKFPEYQDRKTKDYTHQDQALQDRQKIEDSKLLKPQDKKELLSVARMKHLCRLNPEIQIQKHWLDLKGIVYFQLKSGGTVRDAGQAIYFSSFDPKSKEVAEQLASLKFGKKLELIENKFLPKKLDKEPAKNTELSR